MKATELRIGNLITIPHQDGKVMKVLSINDIEIETDIAFLFSDAFEPIPLTEKWLLKFGFEYYVNINNEYLRKDNVYFYGNGLICQIGEYSQIKISIKYVHQLQNLYFVLTGKELEIK